MVVNTYFPSTKEAEAGRSRGPGQPRLLFLIKKQTNKNSMGGGRESFKKNLRNNHI
jgi:hypothetical protein